MSRRIILFYASRYSLCLDAAASPTPGRGAGAPPTAANPMEPPPLPFLEQTMKDEESEVEEALGEPPGARSWLRYCLDA
jgi:hypothetical protein